MIYKYIHILSRVRGFQMSGAASSGWVTRAAPTLPGPGPGRAAQGGRGPCHDAQAQPEPGRAVSGDRHVEYWAVVPRGQRRRSVTVTL